MHLPKPEGYELDRDRGIAVSVPQPSMPSAPVQPVEAIDLEVGFNLPGGCPLYCPSCFACGKHDGQERCTQCGRAMLLLFPSLDGGTWAGYLSEMILPSGEFGTVYVARGRRKAEEELQLSEFAVKTYTYERRPRVEHHRQYAREAFEREPKLMARLDHPNIPHVYAVHNLRELVENKAKTALIVMELVRGKPILVEQDSVDGKCFSEPVVRRMIEQILDAVVHAHSRGVFHRDVTPNNIIIDGSVADPASITFKLIDFGIGRDVQAGDDPADPLANQPDLTRIANQAFMDPDLEAGTLQPDRLHLIDLWGIGVTAIYMLGVPELKHAELVKNCRRSEFYQKRWKPEEGQVTKLFLKFLHRLTRRSAPFSSAKEALDAFSGLPKVETVMGQLIELVHGSQKRFQEERPPQSQKGRTRSQARSLQQQMTNEKSTVLCTLRVEKLPDVYNVWYTRRGVNKVLKASFPVKSPGAQLQPGLNQGTAALPAVESSPAASPAVESEQDQLTSPPASRPAAVDIAAFGVLLKEFLDKDDFLTPAYRPTGDSEGSGSAVSDIEHDLAVVSANVCALATEAEKPVQTTVMICGMTGQGKSRTVSTIEEQDLFGGEVPKPSQAELDECMRNVKVRVELAVCDRDDQESASADHDDGSDGEGDGGLIEAELRKDGLIRVEHYRRFTPEERVRQELSIGEQIERTDAFKGEKSIFPVSSNITSSVITSVQHTERDEATVYCSYKGLPTLRRALSGAREQLKKQREEDDADVDATLIEEAFVMCNLDIKEKDTTEPECLQLPAAHAEFVGRTRIVTFPGPLPAALTLLRRFLLATTVGIYDDPEDELSSFTQWGILDEIAIFLPSPLLKSGLRLVDVPGFAARDLARTAIIKRTLAVHFDCLVLLVGNRIVEEDVWQVVLEPAGLLRRIVSKEDPLPIRILFNIDRYLKDEIASMEPEDLPGYVGREHVKKRKNFFSNLADRVKEACLRGGDKANEPLRNSEILEIQKRLCPAIGNLKAAAADEFEGGSVRFRTICVAKGLTRHETFGLPGLRAELLAVHEARVQARERRLKLDLVRTCIAPFCSSVHKMYQIGMQLHSPDQGPVEEAFKCFRERAQKARSLEAEINRLKETERIFIEDMQADFNKAENSISDRVKQCTPERVRSLLKHSEFKALRDDRKALGSALRRCTSADGPDARIVELLAQPVVEYVPEGPAVALLAKLKEELAKSADNVVERLQASMSTGGAEGASQAAPAAAPPVEMRSPLFSIFMAFEHRRLRTDVHKLREDTVAGFAADGSNYQELYQDCNDQIRSVVSDVAKIVLEEKSRDARLELLAEQSASAGQAIAEWVVGILREAVVQIRRGFSKKLADLTSRALLRLKNYKSEYCEELRECIVPLLFYTYARRGIEQAVRMEAGEDAEAGAVFRELKAFYDAEPEPEDPDDRPLATLLSSRAAHGVAGAPTPQPAAEGMYVCENEACRRLWSEKQLATITLHVPRNPWTSTEREAPKESSVMRVCRPCEKYYQKRSVLRNAHHERDRRRRQKQRELAQAGRAPPLAGPSAARPLRGLEGAGSVPAAGGCSSAQRQRPAAEAVLPVASSSSSAQQQKRRAGTPPPGEAAAETPDTGERGKKAKRRIETGEGPASATPSDELARAASAPAAGAGAPPATSTPTGPRKRAR